ncbi:DNA-binding transcriptional ArsR family regulator [Tamaricihabitans halophyticus]|uniref:DNA-binding transcriptional ArsR family regulator n=1 Tax=Tamaricihabitans halophyticus TaxID=1262583 RepID=A0A4R2QZ04_9PSEU|nr:DUF5937 family protein [Tamaricihabitans halophyticus]TCP54308.1 DNA-binding transcriptional ArsR family regulator [Tamaricihabitans halophyticus]
MLELVLGTQAAVQLRFACSPLQETLAAVQVLNGTRRYPVYANWLAASTPPEVAQLATLLSGRRYCPDFLTPPPEGPDTTAEWQLAQVRATPANQVATELVSSDARPADLPANPASARDLLADQLEQVWRQLLEPAWPRLRMTLHADIEYRARRFATAGIAHALTGLHAKLRLAEHTVLVDGKGRGRTTLDERGLLLLPSVFGWPTLNVMLVPPWQPTVVYPARGAGELFGPQPAEPSAALAGVLGRARADLLRVLREPASTSALAATLHSAPSTVSEHLQALRAAGLVARARVGRSVYYECTRLGEALLAGGTDPHTGVVARLECE